jgi:hypothetical protein
MRTAERKVTGSYLGKPTVAFRGYRDFVVAWREIISVNGRSPDDAVVMLCKCTLPATGRCECVDGSARIFVEG